MRALITGVSGFVGTYLAEKLLECGYEVIGLSRNPTDNKQVKFYSCDITDSIRVEHILKMEQPDEIYHLAGTAYIPLSYEKTTETYDTIVNGTLILYEIIRKLKIDPKILYVGSAQVYGDGKGSSFTEECLLHPNNPYAAAKACADLISEQYHKAFNMRIIRVRPFNHTGPKQSPKYVCSSFAKQIAELEHSGGNLIQVGNLNVKRDFLDVRDVVNAYVMLIKEGNSGEVYNVSSNKVYSIADILQILLSKSKIQAPEIIVDYSKMRDVDADVRQGNNTKLKNSISWKNKYAIEDTLNELLCYWRHLVGNH